MQISKIKKLDTASNRSAARMARMKNGLKIIVTSALMLAASSAMAGIIYLPVGGRYLAPEQAPVSIQNLGGESIRINTSGLTGELAISKVNASGNDESPPLWDIATTEKVVVPFEQQLDLIIDLAEGTVSGHASMDKASAKLAQFASVQGTATCLPLNGLECGQLVVDLELQGVVSDPNDPAIVGQLRMNMLASMIFDGSDVGFWAAMSANARIGGNEGLINSILSMEEGESSGV